MTIVVTCELADLQSEVTDHDVMEPAAEQYRTIEAETMPGQLLIVVRAMRGDTDAFAQIIDHYGESMRRVAYSIIRDHDLAEDAVQNAFIQAWQHLSSLRETSALRPWLMRILVNQCISFQRRRARSTLFLHQTFAEQAADLMSHLADEAKGHREGLWDLAQAVKKLPRKQQMAIVLHYYQGMTLLEMSQTLQISENTLKKRIQAALTTLRCMLQEAERERELFLQDSRSRDDW